MKALSLKQPWASLVALGHKQVETRRWKTTHTGRIAIHASLGFSKECKEFAAVERAIGRLPGRIPLGAIIATVELVECVPSLTAAHLVSGLERHLGDYSEGRYGWFLKDVRVLAEPIPCKGALSLWTVPPEIERLLP